MKTSMKHADAFRSAPSVGTAIVYTEAAANGADGKAALSGLAGCFLPGQLSAVLGPAGSGKTNMMRALAGQPLLNRSTAITAQTFHQHNTAIVDGFDTLVPNLTVEQQLLYAAELSCGLAVPAAERAARVAAILRTMGLESVRNTRIGNAWFPGITAVERRLLSISVALTSAPSALCVDSPTHGLPAADGNRIVAKLKRVATERGIAVVAALDSPTSAAYAHLDRVLVLLQGRTVYLGPTGDALVMHFETHCLEVPAYGVNKLPEAEWLLDALSQPAIDSPADAYAKSAAAKAASAEVEEQLDQAPAPGEPCAAQRCGGGTPAWFSLWTLFRRRTLANITDPVWVALRLAVPLFFCVLIMSVYWKRAAFLDPGSVGNIISILWMFALLPAFVPVNYMGFVVLEMPMYLRERRAGWYSSSVYFVHKVAEELLAVILMTLPLSCILYFPLKLHGDWSLFWLVYVATSSIGVLFMYLLSTLAPTLEAATSTANTFLVFLLFFAGCLIRTIDIPGWWHWFSYLDFMRYSYGALMVSSLKIVYFRCNVNEYSGRLGWDATLLVYNLQAVNKWRYLGYEYTFVAGLAVLLWLALVFKRSAPQYNVSIALRRS